MFRGLLIWKELRSGLFSCPFCTLHVFILETGNCSITDVKAVLDKEILEYPVEFSRVHKAPVKEKCTYGMGQCCIISWTTLQGSG